MVTVYGVITAGYAGTYNSELYNANNGLFIADGDYSIMLYRVPGNVIPEGAVVGETVVKAYAKVALFKGLIQLTYENVQGATLEIVSEPSRAFVSNEVTLDAMPSKMTDLSRQAKITGEVTSVSKTIDGANDVTVAVKVSDSFTMNVFLKKQAGWDYAALATALAVGNKVEVKGFIAIYDANADGSPAKYASSTGWQIVNPTSAAVVAE